MNSKSEKLNLKGLSKAFGVSQVSVRNWIDRGIPCKRTSKGYTFDLTEAIQWREKHLQKAKQGSNNEYEAARTEKEIYRAKMAKLNFERMDGSLVSAKDVTDCAFEKARQIRDSLLNIPARVSPILAAEKDSKKVHEILDKEIRQCLEVFAEELVEVKK
jgi:phage terminase Nu1 subunit (DNA packaging protein)